MRVRLLFFAVLFLGGCTPRLIPAPQPTQIPPTVDASPIPTLTSEADLVMSLAIKDLSARLALDPEVVGVLSTEPTLWPDAALGCPRPGAVYAQQTVPGYRLRLEANDVEYVYHTDSISTVILCVEDNLPSFPVTPGEIDHGEPWIHED